MQTGALPALPLDVGGGPLLKVRSFQNVSLIESLFPKMNAKLSLYKRDLVNLAYIFFSFWIPHFCK